MCIAIVKWKKHGQIRSVEQEEAVHASTMGEGDQAIIQTMGSGESMMFSVPVLLDCDKMIVLIVPVVTLKEDILHLCHH